MEILHDYPGSEGQGFNDSMVVSCFCVVATMQCWFVSPFLSLSLQSDQSDIPWSLVFWLSIWSISITFQADITCDSSLSFIGIASDFQEFHPLHPFFWIFPIVFPVINSSWSRGVLFGPHGFFQVKLEKDMVVSCGLKQTLSKGFTLLGGMKYDANKGARAGLMDGDGWRGWGWGWGFSNGDGSFSVLKDLESRGFSQVFLAQHVCPAQGPSRPQPQVSAPMVCSWASSESELSLSRDARPYPHHLLWKEFRFSWREQLLRNSSKTRIKGYLTVKSQGSFVCFFFQVLLFGRSWYIHDISWSWKSMKIRLLGLVGRSGAWSLVGLATRFVACCRLGFLVTLRSFPRLEAAIQSRLPTNQKSKSKLSKMLSC